MNVNFKYELGLKLSIELLIDWSSHFTTSGKIISDTINEIALKSMRIIGEEGLAFLKNLSVTKE